jgi:hypothetical protein
MTSAFDASIALTLVTFGLCAFRLGCYADSAAHYARALSLAPNDPALRSKQMFAAAKAGSV